MGTDATWSDGRRWVRRHDALWRISHDTVLVVVPERDDTVTVTGPGVEMWQILDTPTTSLELAGQLAELYATGSNTILADVRAALMDLVELGLVLPVE